jgi:beta-lactamase class A
MALRMTNVWVRASFRLAALAVAIAAFSQPATAHHCGDAPVPLDHRDPLLQQELMRALRHAGLSAPIRERQLAVSLVDLSRPEHVYYSGVNDDNMMYAASLPKIGILIALADSFERGELDYDESYRWRITKMITKSSNADASWGAKLVGLRGIAKVMRDPRYCLYDEPAGGVWVGRAFEKGGESYRDPMKSISHAASARQAARFYLMLDRGVAVSPYWSEWMIERMAPPEYFHKFVGALQDRRGLSFVARKSGTWRQFHADSALIQHGSARYIIVGLAEHADGAEWMKRIAHLADDIVVAGRHRRWRSKDTGGRR